jgi:hypothetical protein
MFGDGFEQATILRTGPNGQMRHLLGASHRRRCEIEDELAGVRRLLKRLELERLARLLEREIVLEGVARNLPPGTRRDDLLTEIDQLRALIKTLKPE